MKLYIPHDYPIHIGHGGKEYVLESNSDVELPDDVAQRVLVRHAETGAVELPGGEYPDKRAREVAEERYTAFIKRQLGRPSEAYQRVMDSAVKRGLLPGPPVQVPPPVPESEG